MNKVKSNNPILRFSEFNDAWVHIKFVDLADKNIRWSLTGGPFGSDLKSEDYTEAGIRIIQLQNIGDGIFHNSYKIFTSEKKADELLACNIYPKEIILSKMGDPVARACIIPDAEERYLMASDGIRLVVDKEYFNTFYIFTYINSNYFRRFAKAASTGSTRQRIGLGDLKKLQIHHPSLPEQQKIASFLTAVDDKIQQLTKKKELLEQYKKGAMQKIFSQQIRFKDDEGNNYPDWGFVKGRKLFKSHSNKNHNGNLPILAATQDSGMILREDTGLKIQSSEASVKTYKIVEKGDFVISLRSFQGGIEYSPIRGICSPAYTILKPKVEIDVHFFRFYFKKDEFIERLSKTVVGIRDGKQISYDAFSWLKLPYPVIQEQQKIADFLSNIDNKIDLVNTQLVKTKEFKKGLLQQMFV